MRDKKDNATFELPGFEIADRLPLTPESKSPPASRPRRARPKQEQLSLLEQTDASGLPVWQRDAGLDLSGLPVWA